MHRIYLPSAGAESWRVLLADPEKHWRAGYSAHALAHAWEAARGLPAEVAQLFAPDAELLLAIPEHKVPLGDGRRESQNDLFALVKAGGQSIAVAVEGKVSEPFGEKLGDWLRGASEGKRQRLAFLRSTLGLPDALPDDLPYQLLHRTASAVLEAERFKTDEAAMVVHSFSAERLWFDAYARFAAAFHLEAEADAMVHVTLPSGRRLGLGWACGKLPV